MVEDLTDIRLLEDRLNHQALHDVQTGLPNRQFFVSRLETALGRLERAAWITLLHLDLDGFSVINDGLGLDVGDRVLDTVARRLEAVVADQHAMVGTRHRPVGRGDQHRARRADLCRRHRGSGDGEHRGVAATGRRSGAHRAAARRGHHAAPVAEQGQAAVGGLRHRHRRRRARRTAAGCGNAGSSGERPPAGGLPTGGRAGGEPAVAVEAVLRWQHPRLDTLSHERCVQLAEQTGVVHAVGLWWLHTAADQARSWRQRTGDALPPVAVDLTSSQAQDPDLVAKVATVLAQIDLRPADLELRMSLPAMRTATGAPVGADAEDNLRVLADMGVRTAIHDFACGAGELACLPELPVHAVRIAPPVAHRWPGGLRRCLRDPGAGAARRGTHGPQHRDQCRRLRGGHRGAGRLVARSGRRPCGGRAVRSTGLSTGHRADARFTRRHLVRVAKPPAPVRLPERVGHAPEPPAHAGTCRISHNWVKNPPGARPWLDSPVRSRGPFTLRTWTLRWSWDGPLVQEIRLER